MKIKKFLSLAMALVMLFSVMPMAAFAEDVDYQQGTLVTYGDGDNEHASEAYTITVPALLKPSQSGTVTATGTWASNRVLTVTADETVTLTNSIKAADEKVLDVTFLGIAKAGSNTEAVSATETVGVADIQNALFGVWSGKFNYNVEMTDAAGSEMPDMPADDGIVPEGGTYYVGLTGESYAVGDYTGYTAKYEAGDKLPEVVNVGDTYVYNDYEYRYGYSYYQTWFPNSVLESQLAAQDQLARSAEGWSVRVIDDTKSSYGKMESFINGEPVTNATGTYLLCSNLTTGPVLANTITTMIYTFAGCWNLTTATIPSNVTDMLATFGLCAALIEAPVIPDGVEIMQRTFMNCSILEVAPLLPSSVVNMQSAFKECMSLKSYVGSTAADGDFSDYVIPNGVTNMSETFYRCEEMVVAPQIPQSVTNMNRTFWGCHSLATFDKIPSGVTNITRIFEGCESLTGTIQIDANPTECAACFVTIDFEKQNLTLTGTSTMLDELGERGDNYCVDCNGICQNNH